MHDHETERAGRWARFPIATCIGIGAFLVGALLAFPGGLSVGPSSLGEWIPEGIQPLWPILHGIGGTLVCLGIFKDRPKPEAAGFAILAVTCSFDSLAVFSIRGFESGIPAGGIVGSVAIGCAARAWALSTHRVGV